MLTHAPVQTVLASAADFHEGNAMPSKKPPSAETKRKTDDKLDQALKDSFPSSDPVSIIEPAPEEPGETSETEKRKPPEKTPRSRTLNRG